MSANDLKLPLRGEFTDFGTEIRDAENQTIAIIHPRGYAQGAHRLFVAAPKLLAACKQVLDDAELNAGEDMDCGLSLAHVKKAIAEAEGTP